MWLRVHLLLKTGYSEPNCTYEVLVLRVNSQQTFNNAGNKARNGLADGIIKSVCPLEISRITLEEFSRNITLVILVQSVAQIQFCLKPDTNSSRH